MSVFDLPMACARNMLECMSQNHFETPPYGPLPDASRKLTTAITNMIDALVIAQDAESQGYPMPPIPEIPEAEVESYASMLRPEHTLHRDHAEALTHLVDAREELQPEPPIVEPEPEYRSDRQLQGSPPTPAPPQPWQQTDEERQRLSGERQRQEQELQRQQHDQADRERQDRERHARESAEHERQFVAQAPPQQPWRPGEAPRHPGDPGRG